MSPTRSPAAASLVEKTAAELRGRRGQVLLNKMLWGGRRDRFKFVARINDLDGASYAKTSRRQQSMLLPTKVSASRKLRNRKLRSMR
jgi:hypothetical protein